MEEEHSFLRDMEEDGSLTIQLDSHFLDALLKVKNAEASRGPVPQIRRLRIETTGVLRQNLWEHESTMPAAMERLMEGQTSTEKLVVEFPERDPSYPTTRDEQLAYERKNHFPVKALSLPCWRGAADSTISDWDMSTWWVRSRTSMTLRKTLVS